MNYRLLPYFLAALIVINILAVIDMGFMMPIWSNFMHYIGGDVRTAGKAILTFSIVIGVVTCFAGHIESRHRNDALYLIASQAVMCLGYFGYLWVHSPAMLYGVQVVLGIGGAFQSPVLCALYQHYMPKDKVNLFWGVWNGFYQIAIGIGALVSAYIVHHIGFHGMFVTMFAISIGCLALSTLIGAKHGKSLSLS